MLDWLVRVEGVVALMAICGPPAGTLGAAGRGALADSARLGHSLLVVSTPLVTTAASVVAVRGIAAARTANPQAPARPAGAGPRVEISVALDRDAGTLVLEVRAAIDGGGPARGA